MTKQLLVVENLDINFELHEKNVHAVRNVSFKVAEGETLALVGESGSGKSVTSMSVMRLLPEKFARYSKDSRITFDGISILDADEKTLRDLRGNRISVIFQEPMTSWGSMLQEGAISMEAAPWQLLVPSFFLVTTLFCFNFIGDGLRDALDPKDR